MSDNLNDWKPSCANAVPGQGGDLQEGEGEGEHNLNDCALVCGCLNWRGARRIAAARKRAVQKRAVRPRRPSGQPRPDKSCRPKKGLAPVPPSRVVRAPHEADGGARALLIPVPAIPVLREHSVKMCLW